MNGGGSKIAEDRVRFESRKRWMDNLLGHVPVNILQTVLALSFGVTFRNEIGDSEAFHRGVNLER